MLAMEGMGDYWSEQAVIMDDDPSLPAPFATVDTLNVARDDRSSGTKGAYLDDSANEQC